MRRLKMATARAPRIDAYAVISRAIDEAAVLGVSRAYKHTEAPSREDLAASFARAMHETLDEVIRYE